ncbi:MAG: MerR family transcriptional regulator [Gammaproteobacteria bacterium]|nr:MerR family transcriptional regulator [Gammaproteobacteria bacterium]
MSKSYTVNALCKLTLVSVRTLHYYDEINLLKPSNHTKTGHRLYHDDDLLRLQQIVTLKFLGFSLSQIRVFLEENKCNVLESLKMQSQALAKESLRIEKVSHFINYLIQQHEVDKPSDWQTVTHIIQILKSKNLDNQQNTISGNAQIIDIASLAITQSFKTTPSLNPLPVPINIAIRANQEQAYITNAFACDITLIDLIRGDNFKQIYSSTNAGWHSVVATHGSKSRSYTLN